MSNEDVSPDLKWTDGIDKMLSEWCDESKCFQWMHSEAYSRYSRRATAMTISANVAISLSGIANLVLGATITDTTTISIVFGCVSIGIGVVNMVQQQFAWTDMANTFRTSANQWSNITRKIEEQLAIPPSGRKDCATFLKYIKQDMALVSVYSSTIPKDIREKCHARFSAIPNFNVPDICGQLEHTAVYVAAPATATNIDTSPTIENK
jgi:hypothetical protein